MAMSEPDSRTSRSGIWAYLAGIFAAQCANNALIVSLPLVLLHLGVSLGVVAFVTTVTTAIDMTGTLVSGWLARRFSAQDILKSSTWARAAALVLIPALLGAGVLTPASAIVLYVVDALARGVADTARNTVPMMLVGKGKDALDNLNSQARSAFNIGGIVGPALVGILSLRSFSNLGNWLVALVFGVAAAVYHWVPDPSPSDAGACPEHSSAAGEGLLLKSLLSEPWVMLALATSVLFSIMPALRALIPAAFSTEILRSTSDAAWLTLAFGLGATAGSIAYQRLHGELDTPAWVRCGAIGSVVIALGLTARGFWPLAAAIFVFSALGDMAYLSLTSAIQERTPNGAEGEVMSVLRFSGNATSMVARLLMGLAFTVAVSPVRALWLIGAGMGSLTLAQLWLSTRLRTAEEVEEETEEEIDLLDNEEESPARALEELAVVAAPTVEEPPLVPTLHEDIPVAASAFLPPVPKPFPLLIEFKPSKPAEKKRWFDKDPSKDAETARQHYLHDTRGAHFYFRNMLFPMQERFAQLLDHSRMPKVFLHGNPHVDNYAKSARGAAMVDFDRSRIGPYAWDLVRLMVSISLRRKKQAGFLGPAVAYQLRKGYIEGFSHPERPFAEMAKLKFARPKSDEKSTNAYLNANKKWAAEMRSNPLPTDAPAVMTLLEGYMRNRSEPDLLKDFMVEEAGKGHGSMGTQQIYLVVLAPRSARSNADRIFLNIKEAFSDADTDWYHNPYRNAAERMQRAAELYAPGWDMRPGYIEFDGKHFYVRQIPPFKAKLKKRLDLKKQLDFAYAVGTQLGRAHYLSLQVVSPGDLLDHLKKHYDDIVDAGEKIRGEIVSAHERYLRKMNELGLVPATQTQG